MMDQQLVQITSSSYLRRGWRAQYAEYAAVPRLSAIEPAASIMYMSCFAIISSERLENLLACTMARKPICWVAAVLAWDHVW